MTTNNSDLINKAQGIASCLTYNDGIQGPAKHMLHELCHRLGSNVVRIHRKRDGYLMVALFGSSRYLSHWESLLWRLLKLPPKGKIVEQRQRSEGGEG